eukprot:UN24318
MKEFIQEGLVDFAILDVENDRQLTLLGSPYKKNNTPKKIRYFNNPCIFIANYVFDSLPHDAFQVSDGVLYENLLTIVSGKTLEPDLKDPNLLKRCTFHWKTKKVDVNTRYTGILKPLTKILKYYLDSFTKSNDAVSFLFPTASFICMKLMQQLSNNKFILIAGDKCHTREFEFRGIRDPHIAQHGTFSVMANIHALLQYIDNQKNGFSFCTDYLEGYKTILCGAGIDQEKLKHTTLAFEDINQYGPEAFSKLQRGVHKQVTNIDLKMIIFLLRMSCHDSTVFHKFQSQIHRKIIAHKNKNDRIFEDIVNDLKHISDYNYPVNPRKDIGFEISNILMLLEEYDLAIQILGNSFLDCGESVEKLKKLGWCFYNLQRYKHCFEAF